MCFMLSTAYEVQVGFLQVFLYGILAWLGNVTSCESFFFFYTASLIVLVARDMFCTLHRTAIHLREPYTVAPRDGREILGEYEFIYRKFPNGYSHVVKR